VATAGAADLAVFLSVAGDVAPSFKEHIRFAIRLYNPATPVKTIERGALLPLHDDLLLQS
jgi:hypothetical protein